MSIRMDSRLSAIARHLSFAPERQLSHPSRESVCGIIAVVGNDNAFKYLIEGLHMMESRGYDSAGIATYDPDNRKLVCSKYASKGSTSDAINILSQHSALHNGHTIGIAHTRWATHGGKTDYNAHPHLDQSNRIALVHNGVIENCVELREKLTKEGIHFRSETDTEVIVQLIGKFVAEGKEVLDAILELSSVMHGTWGIAVLDRNSPDRVYASCNGSPIVIGIGQGRMFIASEPAAFAQFTKDYIALENGEVCVVTANSHTLDQSRIEQADLDQAETSPAPFPHWTIKEIMEQPQAVSRALNYGGRISDESHAKLGGLEHRKDIWQNVKHLLISACGTSLHAAVFGAILMRSFGCFSTVQVIDASETTKEHFPPEHGGLLVLSQSGETKDVHRVVTMAMDCNVPCMSIVNAVRSLIARTTGCGVYLNAGRENAVASTKAFTCQAVCLALVASWFSQINHESSALEKKRILLIDSLQRLPTNIGMCLSRIRDPCRKVADQLHKQNINHMFILGRGLGEPIAREAALKIKEITYVHAEGYPSGALKHGPFALIDKGIPIFLIMTDDTIGPITTAAAEVKARNAYVVIVCTQNLRSIASQHCDDVITFPASGVLSSLVAILPFQLIAYELSLLKGNNPDRPRHLAKTVTVD